MKYQVAVSGLAAVAAAAPTVGEAHLAERQAGNVCFVFARGSTEPGGLGLVIGPKLERALKSKFPGMKTIPVEYAASLATNMSSQRTDSASIQKGIQAFQKASSCSSIVAGGYSQGAAVMHNAVPKLDSALQAKIKGVALFGSTRNKQDGGHIPKFPSEKSKTWCNANDGVCGGGLSVNAGHMAYGSDQINAAATWLQGRVGAA